MIIVLLFISLGVLILGIKLLDNYDLTGVGIMTIVIGLGFSVMSVISIFVLSVGLSDISVINEKIALYQNENEQIEHQVELVVQEYMDYESDAFEKAKAESPITLATLYPELKSNELVKEQISLYISNNQKIKEFKSKALYSSIYKWWLYFGK